MPYDSWDDDSDEEIYSEKVDAHINKPIHRGHLAHPTHAHEDKNPLCGDVVRFELDIDGSGKINDVYFSGSGCRISQSCASMLTERMLGKSIDEVKEFQAKDMLELFGARLTPNRQKCCLLPWKVLQVAMYSPSGPTVPH